MTEAHPLRLLAVHAHPDDESSKGAATMAKYVAEGVQVMVATCTGGERGSVLNPALDKPEVWERLPQIRTEENEPPADLDGQSGGRPSLRGRRNRGRTGCHRASRVARSGAAYGCRCPP